MGRGFAITQKPDHLGMVLVADNHHIRAFLGIIADDRLNFGDLWTGRINDMQPGFLDFFSLLRGNPVGPYYDSALFQPLQLVHRPNTL